MEVTSLKLNTYFRNRYFRWASWLILVLLVIAAFVPAVQGLYGGRGMGVRASGITGHSSHRLSGSTFPFGVLQTSHAKQGPMHKSAGVNRTHLSSLPMFTGQIQHAGTNSPHANGAFIGANVNPHSTKTIFFDNMESGAPGWTTVGDNNGHSFWNLANNPNTLTVPGAVNPLLVSYPDSAGRLPAAHSGTHAWWYGDNPNVDPNPKTATSTYMGNENSWPVESSGDGGTSNSENSGSLISPTIDLTSAPNATLSFATWWEIEGLNPAHFDMMYIDVTTNNGSNWTTLGVLNPTTNPLPPTSYLPFSPPLGPHAYPYTTNGLDVPASWQISSANLTPYVGHKIQLRFRFDSIDATDNGFRGWFVDDVGVYTSTGKQVQVSSLSPNIGMSGTAVTITGTGFGARQGSSTVTFSGVQASLIQSWGNYTITAIVPAGVSSGPVVVTVNGAQTAAVNFTVNAQLSFFPTYAFPGETSDLISAQGFAAHESVVAYIDGVNGVNWFTSTADNTGSINISSEPALPNVSYGIHLVLAVGQTSHTIAGVGLLILPVLNSSVSIIAPNQTFSMTGHGFSPNEAMQISVDFNSNSIGSLSCNSNGDCSGNITLPMVPSPGTQDVQHRLIGLQVGAGVGTTTPVTFTPAISLSPTSLAPGGYITVQGGAFTANETVQVYLGSTSGTLEGSTVTDSSGGLNFYFQLPSNLPYGFHEVTVARTSQLPATLVAHFRAVPPKLISTAGIRNGQTVQVRVSGFQSNEIVGFSWNANGGQYLYQGYTDNNGLFSGSFTPPFAPAGSYILTAVGSYSGFQATSSLAVGPGILLSPNPGNPNSVLTVSGGGYQTGETVHVYFQNPAHFVTATPDSTGAFTVSLPVPLRYDPSVTYYVHADSTTGTDHARTQFSYVVPEIYMYNQVTFGVELLVSGDGFASNEQINLYWDYKQAQQRKVATISAASDGSFSYQMPSPPSEPNLGTITVAASGVTSHLQAIYFVTEYAGMIFQPSHAPDGAKVQITGGSFGSNETVTVVLNSSTIAIGNTNSDGLFKTTFIVPNGLGGGSYPVTATGNTSGVVGTTDFIIDATVLLHPNKGPSGTQITVTGSNFFPNTQESIFWYDPSNGSSSYLGMITSSSRGTIKTTITAPSNLIKGNIYYVQVADMYNIGGSAKFTAE